MLEEENPNFFEQLHPDDYVRIYRMDDFDKKWVTHGRLAMHEQNTDFVARVLGGGMYRVQLVSKVDDNIAYKIKGTRQFKVPGRYKPPAALLGLDDSQPNPSGASTAQRPEVGNLDANGNPMQMLNTALVGSVVDLLKTLKTPPPAPANPIPWKEIATVIAPVVTKLIERPRESNVRDEVLAAIREVKEILPQNNPTSSAITDAVKGLKELMGLRDIVDGKEAPPDPETAMWGAAMKALDVAANYMTGKKGGDSTIPAVPQLPAGAPGMPKWKLMLLSQKSKLIQAASFDLAPDNAAETALTFLPQQMHGVLKEFLELPDCVEVTMQTIPELREFKRWTTEFIGQLQTQFLGGDDAEEAEASEASEG